MFVLACEQGQDTIVWIAQINSAQIGIYHYRIENNIKVELIAFEMVYSNWTIVEQKIMDPSMHNHPVIADLLTIYITSVLV